MPGSTLFFSDLHADLGALEALLKVVSDTAFAERYGPVERAVNLGDTVERGYHPCEVIDRLRTLHDLTSVLGNHDEAFIHESPVSGSDEKSFAAGEKCRERGTWQSFFEGQATFWKDLDAGLYAAHGGPIDPGAICPPGSDDLIRWLHDRTWQRISRESCRYFDWSGYHYLPEDAFASVRKELKPGFAVLCGHEHSEAAFVETDGGAADIYHALKKAFFTARGRRIEEKILPLKDGKNYLVRLGIAGPEGYYQYLGWDRCYFGVYYEKECQRYLSLLSFQLGRDYVPPP